MSENELDIFDPNLKKKKKKKRATFDSDVLIGDDAPPIDVPTEDTLSSTVIPTDDPSREPTAEFGVDDDFLLSTKKKKKKKTFDMSEVGTALPKEEVEVNGDDEIASEMQKDSVAAEPDNDLDFGIKKKKKKTKTTTTDDVDDEKEVATVDTTTPTGHTWDECDRDYAYDELLKRVFDVMREKNPDMVAGEKRRIIMKPPQVMRVGTKKSSFSNFVEICRMLHRQPKHLLAFLLSELGTSGSLDGNSQLIIRGRFQQKQIESVLRHYIKEYVTCHTCRSPDTLLQKDTRLYFLQCETCGSRCSVASIKSGFQAVTSKRAAIRAKTT